MWLGLRFVPWVLLFESKVDSCGTVCEFRSDWLYFYFLLLVIFIFSRNLSMHVFAAIAFASTVVLLITVLVLTLAVVIRSRKDLGCLSLVYYSLTAASDLVGVWILANATCCTRNFYLDNKTEF